MTQPNAPAPANLTSRLPGHETPTKTALIVGASRGLGLGLVREHLGRGWAVIATVRDDAGEAALKALKADSRLTVLRADVTSDADIARLSAAVKGPLDLLLLNAGIMGSAHDKGSDPVWLTQVMQTNAFGPIRLAWAFLGHLRSNTGVIAFMSSRMGSIADTDESGYDLYRASKAAQNMLARALWASPGRRQGLTVLSIHPGWVKTDMGGPGADIDVRTSAKGVADQIEANAGSGLNRFLRWNGEELPW